MAEIVGRVASIASLVQIAGQITKLSYSYVSDIKSAPEASRTGVPEPHHCSGATEPADSCGWRPLHTASYSGQIKIVKSLITAGASVCTSTTHFHWGSPGSNREEELWNGHPLHLAVMRRHVDVVELLLKHGANVNASTGCFKGANGRILGTTALHIALNPQLWADCLEPYLKIARMLIAKGASVDGVLDQLQVNDISSFEGYEDVWDKIRGV
ncbi:unnamed protein product [Penicillium glandicola]